MPSRASGMLYVNTLVGLLKVLCVGADRRVRPRLTDLLFAMGRCGIAAYLVPAFTKTTGMITNPHRVLGSRNRGNASFCPVSEWLIPPGRLCLRPPPNTPLRTIRFCCLTMTLTIG